MDFQNAECPTLSSNYLAGPDTVFLPHYSRKWPLLLSLMQTHYMSQAVEKKDATGKVTKAAAKKK